MKNADRRHDSTEPVSSTDEELARLQKCLPEHPPSKSLRFQFIEDHRSEFPIEKMCKVLEVSRSGFYKWRNAEVSNQAKRKALLLTRITDLFEANQGQFGSPRITLLLREEGYIISERTVGKFMKELGLRSSYSPLANRPAKD
ncbi:IS3 family transposase [Paenibacillus sp. FSL K6-1217]|uniref:IS3 family transposase n=1 Tax=Paenibacillus sp. FSL K6-1217 TaxID=2921466 RepID=UPI00324799B0